MMQRPAPAMSSPAPKAYLDAIAPYVGGKSKAEGAERVIKLSSNENPQGPSPLAVCAFADAAASLNRYPEDGCASLREAIARHYHFPADQIICGAGSDEVIGMLVHTFAGVGDEVLFPQHSFLMYRIYTQQYGATPVAAPEHNLRTDVDALLDSVTKRTKIVFLANPNNPTGSYITVDELTRLRYALPAQILLVIDGAYSEYMRDDGDYSDGRELVGRTNTVITRTFSKVYGLPALRIGWGYGPKPVIDAMYKVRSPFNVSQPAIAAAIAALKDVDYMHAEVTRNYHERERVRNAIRAMGLMVSPAAANFLLVHFADEAGKRASDANQFLLSRGIIVREVANYGLPNHLRITIGSDQDNDALLAALAEFVQS